MLNFNTHDIPPNQKPITPEEKDKLVAAMKQIFPAKETTMTKDTMRLAQQAEADPNAPWMTEAHLLCTDHGIPHGNLTERIRALRDKMAQQGEQQPVAWRVWRGDAYELYFDHAAAARRGECFVPHRQPEPLFAGAAPAIMETYIKDHKTPLTENAIDDAWYEHVSDVGITSTHTAFQVGVRVAEKHHGIGVQK